MRVSLLVVLAIDCVVPRTAAQDPLTGCDLVVAIAESVRDMEVTRGDGKLEDYITGDTAYGCEVRLQGPGTLFGELAAPTDFFKQRLESTGWSEDHGYAADGPMETAFLLRRGTEMCHFHGGWEGRFWMVVECAVHDGGDHEDPTDHGDTVTDRIHRPDRPLLPSLPPLPSLPSVVPSLP